MTSAHFIGCYVGTGYDRKRGNREKPEWSTEFSTDFHEMWTTGGGEMTRPLFASRFPPQSLQSVLARNYIRVLLFLLEERREEKENPSLLSLSKESLSSSPASTAVSGIEHASIVRPSIRFPSSLFSSLLPVVTMCSFFSLFKGCESRNANTECRDAAPLKAVSSIQRGGNTIRAEVRAWRSW